MKGLGLIPKQTDYLVVQQKYFREIFFWRRISEVNYMLIDAQWLLIIVGDRLLILEYWKVAKLFLICRERVHVAEGRQELNDQVKYSGARGFLRQQ